MKSGGGGEGERRGGGRQELCTEFSFPLKERTERSVIRGHLGGRCQCQPGQGLCPTRGGEREHNEAAAQTCKVGQDPAQRGNPWVSLGPAWEVASCSSQCDHMVSSEKHNSPSSRACGIPQGRAISGKEPGASLFSSTGPSPTRSRLSHPASHICVV